jgi:hypothetical protein
MASYFQMGHDTENLVGERGLELFKGIILSPLNRNPQELEKSIKKFRERGDFDIVFDPQLYFPRSKRGKLRSHPYYPQDMETADQNRLGWWNAIVSELIKYANVLDIDTINSPVDLARSWREDYYLRSVKIKDLLRQQLQKTIPHKKCFLTIVINVNDLTDDEKIMKTASIVSSSESDGYYIVFLNDMNPRREYKVPEAFLGMMKFIKELKLSGCPIIVSHCSSDLLLYKYAGADHCATGKFFNLRRFTESRFEESSGGGGQLSYWFEHGILAFLREPDLLRIANTELRIIGTDFSNNAWSKEILDIIQENKISEEPKPWLGYGWRQYLSTFCLMEKEVGSHKEIVKEWINRAENNWRLINSPGLFPEEPHNDGSWLPVWKKALSSFDLINSSQI